MKQVAAVITQLAFIAVCAVGVFSFVRAAQGDQRMASCSALCELRPAYAGRSLRAPDFELPDLDGKMWRLSSLLDRPVVLNFWQKDCPECMAEMPELATFTRQTPGVHVITVSVDEQKQDVLDALKVSLKGAEVPFPVLLDPDMTVVRQLYGTTLYPETWIIDTSGVVRVRIDGRRNWSADPLTDGVIEMVSRPGGCPVEMLAGQAVGSFAGLCGDAVPMCPAGPQDDPCMKCMKGSCCGPLRACSRDDNCSCTAQAQSDCGETGLLWDRFSTCVRGSCADVCRGLVGGI